MVYTVYLDLMFILEFIIDYLLLYATGKISGVQIKRIRLILSAIIGALYSVVSTVTGIKTPLLTLSVGVLLVGVSYGFRRLKLFFVFFGTSAAFGGIALCIGSITEGELHFSLPVLVVTTLVGNVVLWAAFRKSATGVSKREYVHIKIKTEQGEAEICALVDTGNSLRDPITNKPILIAELCALRGVLSESAYRALKEGAEEAVRCGEGRFRIVPCKTVSGSALLAVFSPKEVLVSNEKRDISVAVTKGVIADGCGYEGIIGTA